MLIVFLSFRFILIWQTVGLLCVLAGHQIVIAALNSLQLSGRQKGANTERGTVWRREFWEAALFVWDAWICCTLHASLTKKSTKHSTKSNPNKVFLERRPSALFVWDDWIHWTMHVVFSYHRYSVIFWCFWYRVRITKSSPYKQKATKRRILRGAQLHCLYETAEFAERCILYFHT